MEPKEITLMVQSRAGNLLRVFEHVLKSDLQLYPYQIQIKQKLMEADIEKCVTMEVIWSIFWKEHDFYAK